MSIRRKKGSKSVREREKRRKKMLRTKYGQRPLKHARKGMESCFMAAVVWIVLLAVLCYSFFSKGDVGPLVGVVGLAVAIPAGYGLDQGIRGFGEREKNYITCKIGVIGNGLVLFGLAAMFIRGLL